MTLTFSTSWLDPISIGDEGIVFGGGGAFGIGALLVLRCASTSRILMARKSFREGFEGSNQFTFPGGMLRSNEPLDFNACVGETLQNRVLAESGISIQSLDVVKPMDHWPPIIGRYIIRGDQLVCSSILPFYGETDIELPAWTDDSTVHSVAWYDPVEVMPEVTQTNALILAQILWSQWSQDEQQMIKPMLQPHFEAVTENAAVVGAPLPRPPWS